MSEALRLADALDRAPYASPCTNDAASELRRLHAENERLRQINQSHEMKLSVRGYEIQIDDLKALNAELVEALRGTVQEMLSVVASLNAEQMPHDGDEFHERLEKARAALAKVEASK